MKQTSIYLVIYLVLMSCNTPNSSLISTEKQVFLSNISFIVPPAYIYKEDSSNMKIGKLSNSNSLDINLYNFGNLPVSIQNNLTRWILQFDSIPDVKENISPNKLIYYYELNGEQNGDVKTMFAIIIPSDDGPYYLKTISDLKNRPHIDDTFNEIFNSIKYTTSQ